MIRNVGGGRAGPSSAGQLLLLVRRGIAATRRELINATGLSRSTVTQRVDALLSAGLLKESVGGAEGRGRPAGTLTFDESFGHVVAVGLHVDRTELALLDLGGRVLHRSRHEIAVDAGPEPVLREVEARVKALVAEAGLASSATVGVGVGVPGPVDVSVGRVIQPPVMPGWHGYPVRDRLAVRLGVPVFLENDANLMALGEQRTLWPKAPTVLLVTVGHGIGAGIVIDGQLYRGVDGGAGDIGHIRMLGHEERCACGAVGCLAAVASGRALVRQLSALGKDVSDLADVRTSLQRGDADAVASVRTAGQLAGEVLTTVVSVLNPEILVLAGEMADTQGHFVNGLREVIYQRSLPRATRNLRVVTSELGPSAAVIGTAALVVDEVFSPAAVDERTAEFLRRTPLKARAGDQ